MTTKCPRYAALHASHGRWCYGSAVGSVRLGSPAGSAGAGVKKSGVNCSDEAGESGYAGRKDVRDDSGTLASPGGLLTRYSVRLETVDTAAGSVDARPLTFLFGADLL